MHIRKLFEPEADIDEAVIYLSLGLVRCILQKPMLKAQARFIGNFRFAAQTQTMSNVIDIFDSLAPYHPKA